MVDVERSVLLRKYVCLLLCFVLIPMILILAVFYSQIAENLIAELEARTLTSMSETVSICDSDAIRFVETCLRMSLDNTITPYTLKSAGWESVEAIRRIDMYSAQLPFVNDLLAYLLGEDTIYLNTGTISLSTWLRGGEQDRYRKLMDGCLGLTVFPNELNLELHGTSYMIMGYPWLSRGLPIGVFACTISVKYLEDLFGDEYRQSGGAVCVLDASGGILYQEGLEACGCSAGDILDIMKPNEAVRTKFSRQMVSVITRACEQTQWNYVFIMPHAPMVTTLFSMRWRDTAYIICALLVICAAVGVVIAYRLWRPIHELAVLHKPEGTGRRRVNEITQLNRVLRELIAQAEQSASDAYREAEQQSLLHTLLSSGCDSGEEALAERLRHAGIKVNGPQYRVIVLKVSEMDAGMRTELMKLCRDLEWACAADMVYNDFIAILYGADDSMEPVRRKVLTERLIEAEGERLAIGISGSCKSLKEVRRGFTEAVLAVTGAPVSSGQARIITYEAARKNETRLGNSVEMSIRLLEQGVRCINKTIIDEALEQIECMLHDSVGVNNVGLGYTRHVIIHKLMLLSAECGLQDVGEDAVERMLSESVDGFMHSARTLCKLLSGVYKSRGEMSENETYRRVLKFLNEHYCDQEMSLTLMADQFGFSVQYMSHFFFKHSGINFIDYLSDKRMNRARDMIITTNLSVREVVEKVGYLNVSSFTRKFSQVWGASPGKYRYLNQEKNEGGK